MDGRSNYSPVAAYPTFDGRELTIIAHPEIESGLYSLKSGVLTEFNPRYYFILQSSRNRIPEYVFLGYI